MSLVLEFVQQYIPYGFRKTPSGWLSGNCPMCIHNGQSRPDTRGRGGFFFDVDKFQYNCFNCGYKTGWSAGRHITVRLQKLLEVLGADIADIQRLKLQLATEQDVFQEFEYKTAEEEPIKFNWPEIELPKVSYAMWDWLRQLNFGYNDSENEYQDEIEYSDVVTFIKNRGFSVNDKRLYWCNNNTFQLRKRLFIPYVYKGGHRVPPILEFIRMVSEVHHVKPIIAVISRDKNIIELQQERVRGKITLNDAHRAIDEISNGYPDLHIHFLSYESLHLWRKHYLKSLNDEMEFPIAWWDDKNIDKILKPMELL